MLMVPDPIVVKFDPDTVQGDPVPVIVQVPPLKDNDLIPEPVDEYVVDVTDPPEPNIKLPVAWVTDVQEKVPFSIEKDPVATVTALMLVVFPLTSSAPLFKVTALVLPTVKLS